MEDLKVTRDVIIDLLPVYESGEASEDTQRLVREYLAKDAELSRLVSRLKQARLGGQQPVPPPEVELESLKRTKKLLKQQSSIMALAIFFNLAPFLFTFKDNQITFLMIRDAPIVGGAWLLTAAIMWVWYAIMRRKLKVL